MDDSNGKHLVIQPRLLDRRGMSLCLSISPDTLDVLRKRGCPCIHVVGTSKVLYDPDDMVSWLKEQAGSVNTRTERKASAEVDRLLRT